MSDEHPAAHASGETTVDADTLLARESWHVLADHSLEHISVLPGTLFLELATRAYERTRDTLQPAGADVAFILEAFEFREPVFFDAERPPRLEVSLSPVDDGRTDRVAQTVTLRANGRTVGTGRVRPSDGREGETANQFDIAPLGDDDSTTDAPMTPTGELYAQLRSRGNTYGPRFTRLQRAVIRATDATSAFRSLDEGDHGLALTLALDACVQLIALAAAQRDGLFVLERIERVELRPRHLASTISASDRDGGGTSTIHARLVSQGNSVRDSEVSGEQSGRALGHALLTDSEGDVLAALHGVTIRFHRDTVAPDTLAIAATFTAEPLADGLDFWFDFLGRPARPAFAPFNQVFQELLDPGSVLQNPTNGANILLLRLEDWLGTRDGLRLRVSDEQREALLAGRDRVQLPNPPNPLEIAQLNDYETEHLYQEIFLDRVYGKNGIRLDDGAVVVDVGANIGMFSLWLQRECRNPRVFAIEPAPAALEVLAINTTLYAEGVTVLACGLGRQDGEAAFTYYARSSVFSGFKADKSEDERAIRTIVGNVLRGTDGHATGLPEGTDAEAKSGSSEVPEDIIDELLSDRVASTTLMRPVRTLSSIIREHGIERIDLLKIDAEKSELDILAGITDADWPKIQQIVLEIHDLSGALLEEVRAILIARGFDTLDVEEDVFQGSGFRNLYARRSHTAARETTGRGPDPCSPCSDADPAERRLTRAVDDFIAAMGDLVARSNVPFLVAICPASPEAHDHGPALEREEERLIHALQGEVGQRSRSSLQVISSSELVAALGADRVHDRETERLGAIPYTPLFFSALATRIARWLRAREAPPLKAVVLDCDQTLWRGVCGEDGPLGVSIDPPHAYLQEFMRQQRDEGVLLALASKNREEDVRAVFADNPGMRLDWSDISAQAINWSPKSGNILTIAEHLSIGLDSIVFIDDNPIECAEVEANCPGVVSLPLPREADAIPAFLDNLWIFDRLAVTDDDRVRALRYGQERQRESFRATTSNFAEFLAGLELVVDIASHRPEQLPRMSQLTQRTNQFNLTTIRRDEAELAERLATGALQARVVSVRDRFGEYGLVGLVLWTCRDAELLVDTFLLSCRVLGRGVEHRILAELGRLARDDGRDTVVLEFRRTARNEPARRFLEGVAERADGASVIQRDDGSATFRIPASAAQTTEVAPADDASPSEDKAHKSPAASSSSPDSRRREAARLLRIATELQRPESVRAAIEEYRRRHRPALASDYVAPSGDIETAVANAWQEILGLEQIGVDDNFFELGGTSLKAVQLIAWLRRGVAPNITIVSLFEHPTVRKLAQMLRPEATKDVRQTIAKSADRGAKRRDKKRARKQKSGRKGRGA